MSDHSFGHTGATSGDVIRRTLTPEMKRYFMTIAEAAVLTLQAGAMGQGGEIFVLDMGEPVHILDLAKRMIDLSGHRWSGEIDVPQDDSARVTRTSPGDARG